jgi:hypothetical protein
LEFAYWIEEILSEMKMAELGICILDRGDNGTTIARRIKENVTI